MGDLVTAYLALGSNLGDRLDHLRRAIAALGQAPGLRVVARSGVYQTDAVADEPQPRYLNAVLRVETTLAPRALLALCLDTERALGRVRPPGKTRAARTIDIDVLLVADAVIDEPGLSVPHAGMLARPFVRIPLGDVATAGLQHPVTGERLDVGGSDPGVQVFPGTL